MRAKETFMRLAIHYAKIAEARNDYAIGAVIVKGDDAIVGLSNQVKQLNDSTRHVEIEAIRQAVSLLGRRYLQDCVLYTTHEPCPMCTGAAIWARLGGIVWGTSMVKFKRYGLTRGNKNFKWRTIDIRCRDVVKKSSEPIKVREHFLSEETDQLFHSS